MAMVTPFGRRLAPAIALVLTACAAPTVVVTPPAPGAPYISALPVEPGRLESGCPITIRLTFEDAGRDVTRAVPRWWARTGYSRHDEGTDVLPFAPAQFQGKSDGRAEVVIVPPHAGNQEIVRADPQDPLLFDAGLSKRGLSEAFVPNSVGTRFML
jgi:hypothetical protein